MDSIEHRQLSSIVKGLHDNLRKAHTKCEGDIQKMWQDHLDDENSRKSYSKAILELASRKWPDDRIRWCFETAINYFYKGGMQRSLLREARLYKRQHPQSSNMELLETNNVPLSGEKLKLLDVGSCYNPFSVFPEFETYAIDLTPATEDVFPCDFLQLNIDKIQLPNRTPPLQELTHLPPQSFHIVVFSLVLEYLPAAQQRLAFCQKAWLLLKENGLLFIITPDSKSVNHNAPMMKSWKQALESLGFTRNSYEKLKHIHCMSYRKNKNLFSSSSSELAKLLYIPQDFKTFEEEPSLDGREEVRDEEEVKRDFAELPSFIL